jgi:xylulokinase
VARDLVAGVDCSTQSTKVLVVDPGSGTVVAEGRGGHEVTGSRGARETHPDQWWMALREALAQTGCAGQVRSLSIGGQQHGLVTVDDAGRPLRPAVLWNDTRSAPDAAALIDDLGGRGEWAQSIGSVPLASFTVTTWAWLRRTDPAAADAVAAIRLPHDEITYRLTGRSVTDRGDASGTGWWSSADEAYSKAVLGLDRVRLDPEQLPEVLGPGDAAGEVRRAAAEELGLASGVLVGPGTGDNMAAALGLGLAGGQAAMSLGTSGTVYATTGHRPSDPSGVVEGFADATGDFLPLACTLNATLAVDRVAGWLGVDREAVEPAGEVVVMPYLDGERTPDLPAAAGAIVGLRHDTSPGQILQATYDGVVISLLEALERIAEQAGGLGEDPLMLTGGGSRGTVWRDTVRRLSGREVLVPDIDEAVAMGAAAQAAAVLSGERPRDVVRRWESAGGTTLPPVEIDDATLARNRAVRDLTGELNTAAGWLSG